MDIAITPTIRSLVEKFLSPPHKNKKGGKIENESGRIGCVVEVGRTGAYLYFWKYAGTGWLAGFQKIWLLRRSAGLLFEEANEIIN